MWRSRPATHVDLALKMNRRDMGSSFEVFEANLWTWRRPRDQEAGAGEVEAGEAEAETEVGGSGHTVPAPGAALRASEGSCRLAERGADPDEVIIVMDRTGRPSGQADAIRMRDARRRVADAQEGHGNYGTSSASDEDD